MKAPRRWSSDMCFYCELLDMCALKGGRVVFWCGKRSVPILDSLIRLGHESGFMAPAPGG